MNIERWKARGLVLVGKLIRTKTTGGTDPLVKTGTPKLQKCLTTLDMTSLGVGSCVGTGMYLVAGMVARNVAGPGVVLSFIIAAIASLFSGVCYAEFGVRVPNTSGSAYMYSYVTVGEFIAFIIGWNMILEYLIGTAAGACAISACLNAMAGGAISESIKTSLGTFIGHTPDIMAAIITLLMTVLLVAGVRKSLLVNNVLNATNLAVWLFVLGAGLFYVDGSNWSEHGGFLPYGWSGVLAGAATCFYAFIGFDIIATTGEEAQNPQWSIPMSIILSLVIVLTAYITSSLLVTLIVPYDQIDPESAVVEMFGQIGAYKSKFIVAFGALAGLTVSMLGSMFPMPRVVYAMAKDGLIFKSLAEVWEKTGTPAVATGILGFGTAIVSLLMSLDVLVEMMSIGTLMAYTLVSTCVLLLRYQPPRTNLMDLLPESIRSACPTPSKEVPNTVFPHQVRGMPTTMTIHTKRTNRIDSSDSDDDVTEPDMTTGSGGDRDDEFLFPNGGAGAHYGSVPFHGGMGGPSRPQIFQKYEKLCFYLFPYDWRVPGPATEESGLYVVKVVGVLYVLIIAFDLIIVCGMSALENGDGFTITLFLLCLAGIITCIVFIARQPQTRCDLKFKAPCVPLVPVIAVIVNIYLIFKLSILTLVRFLVWMTAGLLMYFLYGIKNSTLESAPEAPIELTIPQSQLQRTMMGGIDGPQGDDVSLPPSTGNKLHPMDGTTNGVVPMQQRWENPASTDSTTNRRMQWEAFD